MLKQMKWVLLVVVFAQVGIAFSDIEHKQAESGTAKLSPMPMITIDGNRFVADGKEFKIWGFNNCRGLWLSDFNLKKAVDQLEFLGVNVMRYHYIDCTLWGDHREPNGTARPAGLLCVDEKTSRRLVNEDRFWRLMDAFRAKGIYVAITLSAFRQYQPGDVNILKTDTADANAWAEAIEENKKGSTGYQIKINKYLPVFDERALALRKEFATQLLTLKRPDTGVPWAKDPQFAFFNTVNECSGSGMIFDNKLQDEMPKYFKDKLLARWHKYLAEKYGSDEKIRAAWKEEGKNGLDPNEELQAKSIKLQPVGGATAKYSKSRKHDFVAFLNSLDMQHQGEMAKHYRSAGWTRPTIYSDINVGAENSKEEELFYKSGLYPYAEDHSYEGDGKVNDLMSWGWLRLVQYSMVPFIDWRGADRPHWSSEINAGLSTVTEKRIPYPLYLAAYYSLQGRDGVTFFAWGFEREYYLRGPETMQRIEWTDGQKDIPFQYIYRVAGRLFKSCEIKQLDINDPRLKALEASADIETDQIYRKGGEAAILTVKTEHFRAIAVGHLQPHKIDFGDVVLDLTSKTLNVVIVEKISDKLYEVTAVGATGGIPEGQAYIKFEPADFVSGTVTFKDRNIDTVEYVNHLGEIMDSTPGKGNSFEFDNCVRLYRVHLK